MVKPLTLRLTISQGLTAYYSPCLLRIVRRALGQPQGPIRTRIGAKFMWEISVQRSSR